MDVKLQIGKDSINLTKEVRQVQKAMGIKPIKGCPNDGIDHFAVCGKHVFVPTTLSVDGFAPAHSAIRLDTYFCKRSQGHKGDCHSHDYLKGKCLMVWNLKKVEEVKPDGKVK